MSLEGKVALITGSTRGIGWSAAKLLAERGATVVLNGTDEQRLKERADELGEQHTGLAFDVADDASVSAAMKQIFSAHHRLDVLVNNAGVLDDALLGMIGKDAIQRTFAVNAVGVINVLQAAVRLMRRAGGGSIVNVSSIIGVTGNAGQVVYGGSKAAVLGITRSAAKELAGTGIRVNAVAPGYIETDMIRHLPPDVHAQRLDSIAMGRVGTPEDVARVIAFLASDDAQYVTGQVIGVDGGMLI